MKSWLLTVFIGFGSINASAMEASAENADDVLGISSKLTAEEDEAMGILKGIKNISPHEMAMVVAKLPYYEQIWLKILRREVLHKYRKEFPDKDHHILGLFFVYNDILKILSQSVIGIAGAFFSDEQYTELSDTPYWKLFKQGRKYATLDQAFLNNIFGNIQNFEPLFFIADKAKADNFEALKQNVSDVIVYEIHELGLRRFSEPILQDLLAKELFPSLDDNLKSKYKNFLKNDDNKRKYQEIISYAKIYAFAAAFFSDNIATFIRETTEYRSVSESSKSIVLVNSAEIPGNDIINAYTDSLRQMLNKTSALWRKWKEAEMPDSKKTKRTDSLIKDAE
jgi:hypothetical protein